MRDPRTTDDEFGARTSSSNEILDQIEQQNGLLKQLQQDLERRVIQRARELNRAMEQSKDAAKSLAESENRIRASIDEAVVTMSESLEIQSFNPAAERMFGYPVDDAIGMHFEKLIAETSTLDAAVGDQLPNLLNDYVEGELDLIGTTSAGTRFPVNLSLSPIMIDGRQLLVAAIRDISLEHNAQAERETMNQKLVESSRQIGMAEMATGVLHNIGNVLNSVNLGSGVITDMLRSSKITSLRRIVDLLSARADDLIEFVRDDRRGQALSAFLEELTVHLEQENSKAMEEMADLHNHIEHMQRVVAMQQGLANVFGALEDASPRELADSALAIQENNLNHILVQVSCVGVVPKAIRVERSNVDTRTEYLELRIARRQYLMLQQILSRR